MAGNFGNNNYHPKLSGRRTSDYKYNHGFSSSQIQSLSAMCQAFIPPISPPTNPKPNEAISSFYASSGSQFPIPQEV